MSAKDIFHDAVRSALEKEGWIITHDPLFIKVNELVAAGVPKEDIVLAFKAPYIRQFTGFAVG